VTSRNKKIYTRASDVPSSWYDKEGYLKKRYRHRVRLNPQGTTSRKRVAKGKNAGKWSIRKTIKREKKAGHDASWLRRTFKKKRGGGSKKHPNPPKRGRQKKNASGFPTGRFVNVEKIKLDRNGRLKQVVIRDSQMPGSLKNALSKKKK
jgi:hypothetical protein